MKINLQRICIIRQDFKYLFCTKGKEIKNSIDKNCNMIYAYKVIKYNCAY